MSGLTGLVQLARDRTGRHQTACEETTTQLRSELGFPKGKNLWKGFVGPHLLCSMRSASGEDRRLDKMIDQPVGRAIVSARYLDLDQVPQRRGANQTSPSRMRRQGSLP